MATRTVKAGGGNFSATGTWVEGVVPTSADDVVTNGSSTGTLTIDVASACRSITIANGVAVTHTSTLAIGDASGGALNYTGAGTISGAGVISFISSSNNGGAGWGITTAGKTLPGVTFNNTIVGGKWVLQDALTSSGTITLTSGTWDTANFSWQATIFSNSSSSTRTVTFGSSAITLTGTTGTVFATRFTGLTLTANSAVVTANNSGTTVNLASSTGGNFNGMSFVLNGAGTTVVTGTTGQTATVANLTRTGTAAFTDGLSLSLIDLTVTGTLTLSGNTTQGANRLHVFSSVGGAQRTITATGGAVVIGGDVTFRDTNITGSPSWTNSGNAYIGDEGGNGSLITTNRTAPATQTWRGAGYLDGTKLNLAGIANAYASAPDIAAYTGSGIMRWAVRVALSDWTPSIATYLIAHYLASAGNFGWRVFINTSGNIQFGISSDGNAETLATSSGAPGLVDGTTYWIGLEYNTATGAIAYYKAADQVSVPTLWSGWTLIGTSSQAAVTPFNSAQPITVGAQGDGGAPGIGGTFYRALVYTNTSTLVFDADFTAQAADTATFTESSSNAATVTVSHGSGNWSDAKWTNRQPLPQDNVIVKGGGGTLTLDYALLGANLDFTGFTGTATRAIGLDIFGNLTLASGMTWTGSTNTQITFRGRGAQTLTTNGRIFNNRSSNPGGLTVDSGTGTLTLADALAVNIIGATAGVGIVVTSGAFDTAGFSVDVGSASSGFSVAAGATCNLHASIVNLYATSGTVWTITGTVFAGSSTIVIPSVSTTSRTFAGGNQTYGTLTYTVANSPGALVITGTNAFTSLNVSPGRTLTLPSSQATRIRGDGFLCLPGTAGNYASAPDSAGLSITGDIDLRVRVAMVDWTPAAIATLVGKWDGAAGQSSYIIQVNTNGTIKFSISQTGASNVSATSSVAPTVTDGQPLWIRATWSNSGDVANIYTAPGYLTVPTASDFTLLGTANLAMVATGIFDGNYNLEIGSSTTGAANPANGCFYRAQVRNGIDGTLVFDADFTNLADGTTSFAESSSNAATVTVNGSASHVYPAVTGSFNVNGQNNGYLRLPGVAGNYASAPDSAALSITSDITILARVAFDDWTPVAANVIAAKQGASASQVSWTFFLASNGALTFGPSSSGTARTDQAASANPAVADGSTLWVMASWRASDGRIQFFTASGALTNPVASDFTQLGTDKTANVGSIFDSTAPVEIGTNQTGGNAPATGNFYRAMIYNGVFSTAAFGGTKQFDADFTTKPFGANTFTEGSPNAATVTVNGALAQVGDGRVELNASTGGSAATLYKKDGTVNSQYLRITDSAASGGATWYAHDSVSNTNVSGWTLVTAIGDEFSSLWNTRVLATDSNNLLWTTRAALGDTSILRWNARAFVTNISNLKWNTRIAVGDTQTSVWNVRAALGDAVSMPWNARILVADNSDFEWGVRAAVSDDSISRWNVRKVITANDKSLLWTIRRIVGDDNSLRWNVWGLIRKNNSLVWTVRSLTDDQFSIVWNDHTKTANNVSADWAIRAAVGDASDFSWITRAALADLLNVRWNTRTFVADTLELDWRDRVKVGVERSLRWGLRYAVKNDNAAIWITRNLVDADSDLLWNVTKKLSKETDILWTDRIKVGNETVSAWKVRAPAGDILDLIWGTLEGRSFPRSSTSYEKLQDAHTWFILLAEVETEMTVLSEAETGIMG